MRNERKKEKERKEKKKKKKTPKDIEKHAKDLFLLMKIQPGEKGRSRKRKGGRKFQKKDNK